MKIKNIVFGNGILLIGFMAFAYSKPILLFCQLVFIVSMLPLLIKKFPQILIKNYYFLLMLPFILIIVSSIFWSAQVNRALDAITSTIQIFFLCTLINLSFNTSNDFKKFFKIFVFSSIFMVCLLLLRTSASEWNDILFGKFNIASTQGRLGPSIGIQTNQLAEYAFYVFATSIFLLKDSYRKYVVFLPLMLFIIFFTKSRSTLVAIPFFCIIYYILSNKTSSKKLIKLITICGLFYLIIYAIVQIPFLYDSIGFRFDNFIQPAGMGDASVNQRKLMITSAFDLFEKNPILGVGINNFGYYGYNQYGIWGEVYAHNNYLELLADVGIVGFLFYYGPLIWSMVYIFINRNKLQDEDKNISNFILSYMLTRLLLDYGRVSYYLEIQQIMNLICIAWAGYLLTKKSKSI